MDNNMDKHLLLFRACENKNLGRVIELVEQGIDINFKDTYERTPLHIARSVEIARYLVKKGANIHCKTVFGETPLHFAIYDIEILKYLVENGADIYCKSNVGATALDIALHIVYISNKNMKNIIEYLLINKVFAVFYSKHPFLTTGDFPAIISWNQITSVNWTESSHLSFPRQLRDAIFTILLIMRSRRPGVPMLGRTVLNRIFRTIGALKYYVVE
jgi:hypothetical protein